MHREPAATWFGIGQVSSSDGQHFYLGGEGETGGPEDAHYGRDPVIKLYTHISDRYAPFHVKVITGTSGEAIHVLDGLVNHDSTIDILAHHTDGGGLRLWLRERFQAARRADAATEVISGALSGGGLFGVISSSRTFSAFSCNREPGAAIRPAELSGWLAERLAPLQNPRYIAVVDSFERTPSQRIAKRGLPRDTTGCWDRLA